MLSVWSFKVIQRTHLSSFWDHCGLAKGQILPTRVSVGSYFWVILGNLGIIWNFVGDLRLKRGSFGLFQRLI